MGKYRGGKKPWEDKDADGRKLDPRQFPELNAVFYNAHPSKFIKMRIQVLTLMGAAEPFLAPAFAVDRPIGSFAFGGSAVPSPEDRQLYVRTEAVTIVHHASEALLRLFFAHVEHPECPWLGMSASTSFKDFKEQVDDALTGGFNRDDIAALFLGGADPEDASIDMSPEEFEGTVDSIEMLLVDCATRFLDDSFLYNAVKHGLTAIDLDDDEAKMVWTNHEGESIPMHTGSMHVYLHRKMSPSAKPTDPQWFITMDDPNPERDLAVATLITWVIDSLWAVARRRYMGVQGSVWFVGKGSIEMALYAPINSAANLLKRMDHELIKVKADGEVDGTNHQISVHHIPEEWDMEQLEHQPRMRAVELQVREQDEHIPTVNPLAYLPIVPRGFAQGSTNESA